MAQLFHHPAPLALITAATLLIGGCQSFDQEDSKVFGAVAGGTLGAVGGYFLGNQLGGTATTALVMAAGAATGAWLGSQIAAYLTEEDQKKAVESVQMAAVTGETNTWENPDTGVSGTTKVVSTRTVNETISVPVLKGRVQQVPPLHLIGEPYIASRTANIRGGPAVDYETVGQLDSGKTAMVAGKVQEKEWYMISEGGAGSGFVATSLLSKAPPNAEVVFSDALPPDQIEEKTINAEQTCRTVAQTITLADGSSHEEEVTACQSTTGWQVA